MKALLLSSYGHLEYADVPDPVMKPGDALVSIRAAGICGSDVHGMDGGSGRRLPPLIMGHEAAGVIADVPAGAESGWHVGDRVTFDSTLSCGRCPYCRRGDVNLCNYRRVLGVAHAEYRQDGAFADQIAIPQRLLHRLPDQVTFSEGAMVEPLSIALHAVSRQPPGRTDTAVVIGSGVIGQLIVQVLKASKTRRVIAVDVNPTRLDQARRHGAEGILGSDPSAVVAEVMDMTSGAGAAVAYEAVGVGATVELAMQVVMKGGAVVLVGNLEPTIALPLQAAVTRELTLIGSAASAGEFATALEMISEKRVDVAALIGAVAPMRDGAAWFTRLGRAEGDLVKVVLEP